MFPISPWIPVNRYAGSVRWLLERLRGRCPFHDGLLPPLRIAELEEATGVRPGAAAELWALPDGVPSHYDPDLVDCGDRRCRKRRGLPQ